MTDFQGFALMRDGCFQPLAGDFKIILFGARDLTDIGRALSGSVRVPLAFAAAESAR